MFDQVVLYLQDITALSLHVNTNGDLLHLIRLEYLLLLEQAFWPSCQSSALLKACLLSRLLVGFRDGLWYSHLSRLAISGISPVSEQHSLALRQGA